MAVLLVFTLLAIVFFIRLYLTLPNRSVQVRPTKRRSRPCKTCIVLGSGGHTAEMLQLIKSLDPTKYTPRSYVYANTDILSKEKAIVYEQSINETSFQLCSIPRARAVGQSLSSVPATLFFALLTSARVLIQQWPDIILCNGPGSCIPICMLSYIPRILGIKKIEIIYIESFARVETLSLTGKLLYPFADRFLVQWPELTKSLSKAEYRGILV